MIRSIGMLKSSSNNNKTKIQCKKHPKHRQSPGVCSLCLTKKLSKVSTSDNNRYALTYKAKARVYYYCSSSSSVSSSDDDDYYYDNKDNENDEDDSSCCTSSLESPVRGRHTRIIVSDVNRFFVNDRRLLNGFDKSNKEKKRVLATNNNIFGFWSKLVGLRTRSSPHVVNHNTEMIYPRSQPLATTSNMAVY